MTGAGIKVGYARVSTSGQDLCPTTAVASVPQTSDPDHDFHDHDHRWGVVIDAVRSATGPGARILDLGCGPGTLTARLASQLSTAAVTGIDLDLLLVELARWQQPTSSPAFFATDVTSREDQELLSGLGPFDAIVFSAFVHYFDVAQLVDLNRLCASLLRPCGLLVTAERFADDPDDQHPAAGSPSVDPW